MTDFRKDEPVSRAGAPPVASSVVGPPDIARMSFEEAMAELDLIVRQIEEGRGKLDDAITAYERGVALKRHCEAKLREAEARIEKITITAEGGLAASAFDP
jgi:exodeoxyribonuclease VII small subunit